MRKLLLFISILTVHFGFAQEDGYKTPPRAIADLLLAKPAPAVSIDGKANWMLLMERNSYPSVEELAQPELRIAGQRINPNNYAPSRQNFINNFRLKDIKAGKEYPVSGLPLNMLAGNIAWSPDEKKIAFTNTTNKNVDLYVIDIATRKATKLNKQPLNVVLGQEFTWMDNNTVLYKTTLQPASAAPVRSLMPSGPAIQQNLGKVAPSRTYQDLIRSPYDEQLFAFYSTVQLVKNVNGVETKIGKPAIYTMYSVSPDKKFLLTRVISKPFSYLVPANGFNSTVYITDLNGKIIKTLAELPSSELSPSGYDNVLNAPRNFNWRDDEAATITWCEPLDSGIYKRKSDYHDAVYALSAPFTGETKELFKTSWRFSGISWSNEKFALVNERLAGKQSVRMSRFDPSTGQLETLLERNSTDAYGNPGNPVTEKNKYGRSVIRLTDNNTKILMNNPVGSSPKGDLPFIAKFDLATKKSEIIWRCPEGSFEYVTDIPDADKLVLLTRRESQKDMPNYFIKNLVLRIADQPITHFTNPYPQLEGISKQKITYKRADGVDLSGDLYLPKNYDPKKDGPLPVLMWAYPREFNSAADAAQIRGSEDKFTMVSYGGPVFWVTQGYAVLDNAEMPVVATDSSKKPNDNFVDQLKMNAEAAINKLAELGVGDRNRVGIGGHSYGAFMTANLLAHTNLFKAGIARSGAYNRTLTPFGFQNEDRTYWQAPDLYFSMSPFSYADKIKTPMLLIHGEMDDNPGTFPIQSERLFNAVKGHGGIVRYVTLPYEAHGYRGKENLLHMLYEQNAWLEKYVKNAGKSGNEEKKRSF
ncbi:alpha/beta hydrolase family protein [Pseudobacter ginsenosidimutans]|uniref:Prolyl oligopeptidase family protein n=1 Tax=Pseudobacter ginsenosidimutans TaxID=661488 RepID=A0A4Q7N661_9BACT|nr:prolyl oligopeptidase family serine peptidase [Pseudobacter ginsenosidimutans]QEC45069.1 prolyl oligopeptidase family serine peptidase [Pseudobacter ginsenosidimutans]RZS76564.1 prolyl oligopeptidase family protein [Pseudobacter ginsenosidimutans]